MKQRLLVEWRKLDHSVVVAAISQWRRRLSACVTAHVVVSLLVSGLTVVAVSLLVSGLTVDILSTFCGVFVV